VRRRTKEMETLAVEVPARSSPTEVLRVLRAMWPVTIEEPLIRFGSGGDGGYLLTKEATEITGLFSPGVGDEAGFEEFFVGRGIDCFLADGSVEQPPFSSPRIHFLKKHLGDGADNFSISINSWIDSSVDKQQQDLGLQMDIEGAEYHVLTNLSASDLMRFRFLVIEFHDLHKLVNRSFRENLERILGAIAVGHEVVHAHANNATPAVRYRNLAIPPTLELVAIRSDIITVTGHHARLPHPLDRKNLRHRRDWVFKVPMSPAKDMV